MLIFSVQFYLSLLFRHSLILISSEDTTVIMRICKQKTTIPRCKLLEAYYLDTLSVASIQEISVTLLAD